MAIVKVLMGLRGHMVMFTSRVIIIGHRFNIAVLHISVACSFWQAVSLPLALRVVCVCVFESLSNNPILQV